MRLDALRIGAAALSILISCTDPTDDAPLRGTPGGLSALRWGDGPEEVRRRMVEMPEVKLIRDTIEIHAFAAWMTPDTVEAPAIIARVRRMEFRGGTFLGYPVEWWVATLDDATSFRELQVILAASEDAGKARWKMRRQMHRLYGRSDEPDLDPDQFLAGDWASPATSSSPASTAVGIGKYGSQITVVFFDRAWADKRRPDRSERHHRRMHVETWRRYLADVAKQRGWRMEDLPPQ